MPVTTLVTTVGPTLNCYASVAFADQYDADRPSNGSTNTWTDADGDEKSASLLWATKQLDIMFVWNGYVADPVQPLLWPRAGLLTRNHMRNLPFDSIPLEIQNATVELARQLRLED